MLWLLDFPVQLCGGSVMTAAFQRNYAALFSPRSPAISQSLRFSTIPRLFAKTVDANVSRPVSASCALVTTLPCRQLCP
jgi:hypothetical protein